MDVNERQTLRKRERLSLKRQLDDLFLHGDSFVSFPLRVIHKRIKRTSPNHSVAIVVSVSKKKFKRAVDRNFIKRQIRESYRMQKQSLIAHTSIQDQSLLVGFLYLSKDKFPSGKINRAVDKALRTLIEITDERNETSADAAAINPDLLL